MSIKAEKWPKNRSYFRVWKQAQKLTSDITAVC